MEAAKSDASSDEDTVTDNGLGAMKRWSWKANDAYFVNILLRSCIEIVESGKYISKAQIDAELMDVWHRRLLMLSRTLAFLHFDLNSHLPSRRYFDSVLHPKPEGLQHPNQLWKNTAFETSEERDAFNEQPLNLGKPSAANPAGGMKQKYVTPFALCVFVTICAGIMILPTNSG
jgi:hypothetical protein